MKTIKTLVLALTAIAVALPAAAQPNRLNDKEVEALLDQTKKTYERFWDALDGQLKGSTFRGPSGEWVVKKINEDYKKAVDLARERFTDSYSASTEVGTVLKDAVRIHNYINQQGPGIKGASEWQAHATVLGQLAAVYGSPFPPAEGQAFRRYGDKEVVQATKSIEESSKQFASALDSALKKDKSVPDATRKAMVAEAKGVGLSAKALGSAVGDKKPASALATQLLNQSSKFQTALSSTAAASALQGQWSGISGKIATIAAAFQQK